MDKDKDQNNGQIDYGQEARDRMMYNNERYEEREDIMLRFSHDESPARILKGVRMSLERSAGNTPRELEDHIGPQRIEERLQSQIQIFELTPEDLEDLNIVKNYNPDTGYANLVDEEEGGSLALRKEGKGRETAYYFGKEGEREARAELLTRIRDEMEARTIIGSLLGVSMHPSTRDNLEGIVETRLTRTSGLSIEHIKAVFSAPNISELKDASKNPKEALEKHGFADDVEAVMILMEGAMASGTKSGMQEFLTLPRVIEVAKERKWDIKAIFGDVENWVDDDLRELSTFLDETKEGLRGSATSLGNPICYDGGNNEKLTHKMENDFINGLGKIAAGKKGQEAAWLAISILRSLGEFNSKGYVVLPNGDFILPLGENRILSMDDSGKGYANMQAIKELYKARPGASRDMVNRLPDMTLSHLQWTQIMTSHGRRSIIRAWLGTPPGLHKINLETNSPTKEIVPEEAGCSLAKLDWDSLETHANKGYFLMEWLKFRENAGVYQLLTKTEFRPEDFSMKSLKAAWKYISICMNPNTLTKGDNHLYDTSGAKNVALALFKNMYNAMKTTSWYSTNILPQTIRFYEKNKEKPTEKLLADLIDQNFERIVFAIENGKSIEAVEQLSNDDYVGLSALLNPDHAVQVMNRIDFSDEVGVVTGPHPKNRVELDVITKGRRKLGYIEN